MVMHARCVGPTRRAWLHAPRQAERSIYPDVNASGRRTRCLGPYRRSRYALMRTIRIRGTSYVAVQQLAAFRARHDDEGRCSA